MKQEKIDIADAIDKAAQAFAYDNMTTIEKNTQGLFFSKRQQCIIDLVAEAFCAGFNFACEDLDEAEDDSEEEWEDVP